MSATSESLVASSIDQAEAAERVLADLMAPAHEPEAIAIAQVHATLAEAYARLASAVIVNRTSGHYAIEARPGSSNGMSDA